MVFTYSKSRKANMLIIYMNKEHRLMESRYDIRKHDGYWLNYSMRLAALRLWKFNLKSFEVGFCMQPDCFYKDLPFWELHLVHAYSH
jgi:hypothetical protein